MKRKVSKGVVLHPALLWDRCMSETWLVLLTDKSVPRMFEIGFLSTLGRTPRLVPTDKIFPSIPDFDLFISLNSVARSVGSEEFLPGPTVISSARPSFCMCGTHTVAEGISSV